MITSSVGLLTSGDQSNFTSVLLVGRVLNLYKGASILPKACFDDASVEVDVDVFTRTEDLVYTFAYSTQRFCMAALACAVLPTPAWRPPSLHLAQPLRPGLSPPGESNAAREEARALFVPRPRPRGAPHRKRAARADARKAGRRARRRPPSSSDESTTETVSADTSEQEPPREESEGSGGDDTADDVDVATSAGAGVQAADDAEYLVEEVEGHKINISTGELFLRVKWTGFPRGVDCWQPLRNLIYSPEVQSYLGQHPRIRLTRKCFGGDAAFKEYFEELQRAAHE